MQCTSHHLFTVDVYAGGISFVVEYGVGTTFPFGGSTNNTPILNLYITTTPQIPLPHTDCILLVLLRRKKLPIRRDSPLGHAEFTPLNVGRHGRLPIDAFAEDGLVARGKRLNRSVHVHFGATGAGCPSCLMGARVRIDAISDQILQLSNLLGGHAN